MRRDNTESLFGETLPLNASLIDWQHDPEPRSHSLDPTIIIDCNISGQVWMFDSQNESNEWLTFEGETMDVIR